jgi:hypothetical protein
VLDTGIVIDKTAIEEFVVTKKHKKSEDSERKTKIEFQEMELKEYMKKMVRMPESDKKKKDKIKLHMLDIRDNMEYLQQEQMTEQKFWGLLSLNEDEEFDYGRDILKENTYDQVITLPYTQFPLFTKTDWFKDAIQKPIVQVAGILRSGNLSGATLKAKIQMSLEEEEEEDSGSETQDKAHKETKQTEGDDAKGKQKKAKNEDEINAESDNRAEKILNICNDVAALYPFDLLRKQYLSALSMDMQSYKVRVYLISAQNLTAVGTQLDLKSRLAGMTALCTANPYPALKVGDMPANPESKLVKEYKDRNESVDQNLNPKLFRIYELDAKFPEDWKLEISIWHKSIASFADQLIGSTTIDLENRLHGNLLYINRHSLKLSIEEQTAKIEAKKKANKKSGGGKKGKRELKAMQDQLLQIKKQ